MLSWLIVDWNVLEGPEWGEAADETESRGCAGKWDCFEEGRDIGEDRWPGDIKAVMN